MDLAGRAETYLKLLKKPRFNRLCNAAAQTDTQDAETGAVAACALAVQPALPHSMIQNA
jgi:hypothetical protein